MYVQLVRGKDNFNYHQKTNKPIKTMEKKAVKIRKIAMEELSKIFYNEATQKGKY